jgi:hypothetical protein
MGYKCEKRAVHGKRYRTGPRNRVGRSARSDRPSGGPAGFASVFPRSLLFDFLLWSENLKGSLNKENVVSRVFLFGLFIWSNWELGNPSHLAFFCTHTAAMVFPKSVELKQGVEEPSMEKAKRCELKLPVEIKRTACIRCGGRVPTRAIASCNPDKEEKVPTPVRRPMHIRGMKRKDYKEVSPEPKDYGDSDYSDDRCPSSWAAARRDDNDLCIWDSLIMLPTEAPLPVSEAGGVSNGGPA